MKKDWSMYIPVNDDETMGDKVEETVPMVECIYCGYERPYMMIQDDGVCTVCQGYINAQIYGDVDVW